MPIIRHAHCQNPAQCQACAACNTDLRAPHTDVAGAGDPCVCVMLITPYGPRPGGNERPPSQFGQQPSRPLPRSAVAEVPVSFIQAITVHEAGVLMIARDSQLFTSCYLGLAREPRTFHQYHIPLPPPVNPPSQHIEAHQICEHDVEGQRCQHIEARQICEHDVEGQRYLAPSTAWQCSRCGIKCQHPIDERRYRPGRALYICNVCGVEEKTKLGCVLL
jgi:hypothetical protein